MAQIKYVGPEARTMPLEGGRLVLPGQVVDVPDERADSYTSQDIWKPVSKGSSKAASAAEED